MEVTGQEEPREFQKEQVEDDNCAPWCTFYVDGAVNSNGAVAGIELVSPEGHRLHSSIHFDFRATNNDAEYEALISGLKLALEMKVENIRVFSDSMLVVWQIRGGFQVRGPRTDLYLRYSQELIAKFREVKLDQIPRGKNTNAHALAKLGSQRDSTLLGVIPLQIQEQPSIFREEVMDVELPTEDSWMTPIYSYLDKGELPSNHDEARKLKYHAAKYVIYDGTLYKRGFNQPLLKCVVGDQCRYILEEIHEGVCGNHSGVALWP